MTGEILTYGLAGGLAIALLIAAFTDLRRRKIDNWLTAGVALTAPLFWWATDLSLWPGVAQQFGIALIAFAILAGLFAMRMMGGGDVKLLTALALWLPLQPYFTLLLLMALLGGILTVVFAVIHRLGQRPGRVQIPYGLAISGAGLWVLATTYGPGAQALGTLG
jgi:prepilin peptidase CpaA